MLRVIWGADLKMLGPSNFIQEQICLFFSDRLYIRYLYERHRGVEVRVLACGTEGPLTEINFDRLSGKIPLFTQQQIGTRLSSERREKGKV